MSEEQKFNKLSTGNHFVDSIGKLGITGNVIPEAWYSNLRLEFKRGRGFAEGEKSSTTSKPHLEAIIILSEILYWYRPTEERHEETGQLIGRKKKFKADLLQRSYKDLSIKFGLPKKNVKNAINYLELKGLIQTELRTIKDEKTGKTLNNVMYIKPIPSRIQEITHSIPSYSSEYQGSYSSESDPPTQVSTTYTKTTSTKTNNIYIAPHQIEFIEKMWNIYPYGSKKKVEDWVKFKKPDLNLINNILDKLRQYKQKVIRENREDKYYKQLENWLEDKMYHSDFSPKGGTVNRQSGYDEPEQEADVMARFNPADSDINLGDLRETLCQHIRSGVVESVFADIQVKVNGNQVAVYMSNEFDKERADQYKEQLTTSLKETLKADDISVSIKT